MLEAHRELMNMDLPQFYEGPTGNILRIDNIYCHKDPVTYLYLCEGINQIAGKFYRATITMDTLRDRYKLLNRSHRQTDIFHKIDRRHMVDLPSTD